MVEERVSNAELQRKITELSTRFEQVVSTLAEIKSILKEIESRVRALETSEAGTHPILQSKIDAAWRKIDELQTAIISLQKDIVNTITVINKDLELSRKEVNEKIQELRAEIKSRDELYTSRFGRIDVEHAKINNVSKINIFVGTVVATGFITWLLDQFFNLIK